MNKDVEELIEQLKEYASGGVSGLYPLEEDVKELLKYITTLQEDNETLETQLKAKDRKISKAIEYIVEREELNNKVLTEMHDEAQHIECEAENLVLDELYVILRGNSNE